MIAPEAGSQRNTVMTLYQITVNFSKWPLLSSIGDDSFTKRESYMTNRFLFPS